MNHDSKSQSTPVQSPCVRNCCLNQDDVCVGCFRSLAEITGWSEASTEERLKILARARRRKEAAG